MFAHTARLALKTAFTTATAAPRLAAARSPLCRFQSTLSRDDVLARSVAVLKTFELKNAHDKITLDTRFGEDLGMDSLDYNDALVALEEEFDVVFDDNVANSISTVGEAVEYIAKNHMAEEDILDKEIR